MEPIEINAIKFYSYNLNDLYIIKQTTNFKLII